MSSLIEKESQLEEMVKRLQSIDDSRAELYRQIKIKADEIYVERMEDVPATPANVCLYDRRHWTRSSEAAPRYGEFWKMFSSIYPRWDMNTSKMFLVFIPKISVNPEKQQAELSMFLPYFYKTHYEYVESCKGDVVSLAGTAFEIKTRETTSNFNSKLYLVVSEEGAGHIVKVLSQGEGKRFQEKTRSKNWVDLIYWLRENHGVES